jgi:hypothetical protein
MQLEAEQRLSTHASEQHSVDPAQAESSGEHCVIDELQVLVCESHKPEQQSDEP